MSDLQKKLIAVLAALGIGGFTVVMTQKGCDVKPVAVPDAGEGEGEGDISVIKPNFRLNVH